MDKERGLLGKMRFNPSASFHGACIKVCQPFQNPGGAGIGNVLQPFIQPLIQFFSDARDNVKTPPPSPESTPSDYG
jgi:hypothetical protein